MANYILTRVELLNISTIMFVINESNSLDIKTRTNYYKEHSAVKSRIICYKKWQGNFPNEIKGKNDLIENLKISKETNVMHLQWFL